MIADILANNNGSGVTPFQAPNNSQSSNEEHKIDLENSE
jgi:hypothetical protein